MQEILNVLAGDMYFSQEMPTRSRRAKASPQVSPKKKLNLKAKKLKSQKNYKTQQSYIKSLETKKGKSLASQCGFQKAASVAPGCYNHPQSQPPRPSFSRQKCILGRDSMKQRKQQEP